MNNKFFEDLEAKREKAREDKCDLFDFYNENWDALIQRLERLQERNDELEAEIINLSFNRTQFV